MFKRRRPLDSLSQFREWIWPRAGWYRASQYVLHRLLRLKGDGHSIALGLAIGAGVSAGVIFLLRLSAHGLAIRSLFLLYGYLHLIRAIFCWGGDLTIMRFRRFRWRIYLCRRLRYSVQLLSQ